MRCKICDKILQTGEGEWNPVFKEFDPCNTCLSTIELYEELDDESPIDDGSVEETVF